MFYDRKPKEQTLYPDDTERGNVLGQDAKFTLRAGRTLEENALVCCDHTHTQCSTESSEGIKGFCDAVWQRASPPPKVLQDQHKTLFKTDLRTCQSADCAPPLPVNKNANIINRLCYPAVI